MKRKWRSLLLIVCLAVLCLTACSKQVDSEIAGGTTSTDSLNKTTNNSDVSPQSSNAWTSKKTIGTSAIKTTTNVTTKQTQTTNTTKAMKKTTVSQTKKTTQSGTTTTQESTVVRVGDYITFGKYEQDNNTSNGKEDIEWVVLAKDKNRALVISRYALDCQPYHDDFAVINWEYCTLRKWLNGTFINAAFSIEEKAKIPVVTVSADSNPYSIDVDVDQGSPTNDKIFLLSVFEAKAYFPSNVARQCMATAYADAQGANYYGENGFCYWQLRSSAGGGHAAHVYKDEFSATYVIDPCAIRPALWIDLDA